MDASKYNLLTEKLFVRQDNRGMRGLAVYKPTCMQTWEFHVSDAEIKGLFGGNQSGKSTAGVVEVISECEGTHPLQKMGKRKPPPVFWRVCCVDYVNYGAKVILPLFQYWSSPGALRGGSWSSAWSEKDRMLHYENGSCLEIMSYDQELAKFGGTQRDGTWFDEEPSREIYTECQMRHLVPKGRTIMTMTPVKGMTWVYEDIYEPWTMGVKRIKTIACWHISMYDNPHLTAEQIEKEQEGMDEVEKQIRVYGKFLSRAGLLYTDFHNREPWIYDHNALNNKIIEKSSKWVMIDPHPRKPHAVLFCAATPSGEKWVYDEIWEACDMEKLARMIRIVLNGEEPADIVIDPQAAGFDAKERGATLFDELADHGMVCTPATRDQDAGIMKVRQHFQWNPALKTDHPIPHRIEPPALETGGPLIHIAKKCNMTRTQFLKFTWKDYATSRARDMNDQPQVPNRKDDDFPTLIRYFLMEDPHYIEKEKVTTSRSWKQAWGADYYQDDETPVEDYSMGEYESDWRLA